MARIMKDSEEGPLIYGAGMDVHRWELHRARRDFGLIKNREMKKNWITTVGGVVAAVLVVAGIVWPDKIDPETQIAAQAAVALFLEGAGALVAVLTGIFAKDPVVT